MNSDQAMEEKTSKVLVVEDWRDTIRKLSLELQALKSKPDDEMDFKALQQIDRLERALRGAKKLGINPQGPSTRARPSFAIGEQLDVLGKSYWVARVKADGRLRLTWSGSHHGVGAVIPIKGVRYLVTGAGPRQILLRESTAEECARMDGPWAAPEEKRDMSFLETVKFVVTMDDDGPSPSQLARRARKEKRLAGIAERKAWRKDRATAVRELMGDAVAES